MKRRAKFMVHMERSSTVYPLLSSNYCSEDFQVRLFIAGLVKNWHLNKMFWHLNGFISIVSAVGLRWRGFWVKKLDWARVVTKDGRPDGHTQDLGDFLCNSEHRLLLWLSCNASVCSGSVHHPVFQQDVTREGSDSDPVINTAILYVWIGLGSCRASWEGRCATAAAWQRENKKRRNYEWRRLCLERIAAIMCIPTRGCTADLEQAVIFSPQGIVINSSCVVLHYAGW